METDYRLSYPDFGTWFQNKNEIKKAEFRTTAGVNARHLLLYIITGVASILLIIPYGWHGENVWHTILMSVGASGLGAALIGYFNELAHNKIEQSRIIVEHNDYIVKIYKHAFTIFACQSFSYLKSIPNDNGKDVVVKQQADKVLFQLKILSSTAEEFILKHYNLFDGEAMKFYLELNDQIMHFEGSLQNPIDTENLIDVMEGIRLWLRVRFKSEIIKTHFYDKKFDPCFDPYGISRGLTGVDAVDFWSLETPPKVGKVATKAG